MAVGFGPAVNHGQGRAVNSGQGSAVLTCLPGWNKMSYDRRTIAQVHLLFPEILR